MRRRRQAIKSNFKNPRRTAKFLDNLLIHLQICYILQYIQVMAQYRSGELCINYLILAGAAVGGSADPVCGEALSREPKESTPGLILITSLNPYFAMTKAVVLGAAGMFNSTA